MPSLTSISFGIVAILCTASCTFRPSIDADGNVTIRKPHPLMRSNGIHQFERLKRTQKITKDPRYTDRVNRVASRLRKVIDLPGAEWEFVVFKDNSANAFCLPGGKVGINTGVFQITGNDDALLAAVMGHEISHATANHAGQRMYRVFLHLITGAFIWHAMEKNDIDHAGETIAAYAMAAYVFDNLALTRRQEYESDKMGAIFMAKAGYDPRKSVLLWKLLRSHHFAHGNQKPEFLRTHPDDNTRIKELEKFMPIAMRVYRASQLPGTR